MDADSIKSNLQRYAKDHALPVAEWCRRTGWVETATLRAFLSGRSRDIGITRLVALADAAGVGLDELIGRVPPAQTDILELAAPLILAHGDTLSLRDISAATRLSFDALRAQFPTIENLIIAVYQDRMGDILTSNISKTARSPLAERLADFCSRCQQWVAAHPSFFRAFESAILTASPHQRATHQLQKEKLIEKFDELILAQAEDLLPMQPQARLLLAELLLNELVEVLRSHFPDNREDILTAYRRITNFLLLGKLRK